MRVDRGFKMPTRKRRCCYGTCEGETEIDVAMFYGLDYEMRSRIRKDFLNGIESDIVHDIGSLGDSKAVACCCRGLGRPNAI
ncbi:hypothetical protein MUK42_11391 [Musa troglodytarum]|uniref:Uncharacterized protein n=1 Tax=Musa troglodytarum TaxID=320322 RepID=A0A9E7L074_9LILI|nr:hypothetical protein MUK42_11391 [Musa troglodytarum]